MLTRFKERLETRDSFSFDSVLVSASRRSNIIKFVDPKMPTICGLTISNIVVGEIQILLAVILFGCSFVLQRSAMIDGLLPLSYNVGRYGVSAVLMILYKICEVQWQPTKPKYEPLGEKQNAGEEEEFHSTSNVSDAVVSAQWQNRKVISNTWGAIFLWGSALGISGIGGSVGQQLGLVTVSAGKTAFISGLFVIVTPFVEWLCPGYNISIPAKAWGAAALSLIGLSLLSGCASADVCFGGAIGTGEVLVFLSMFCWVLSILASDKGSKVADVVWLSVVDFSLTTVVTLVFALVYEPQVWVYPYPMFTQNWKIILITGLIEAVAFNFANLGQVTSRLKSSDHLRT